MLSATVHVAKIMDINNIARDSRRDTNLQTYIFHNCLIHLRLKIYDRTPTRVREKTLVVLSPRRSVSLNRGGFSSIPRVGKL